MKRAWDEISYRTLCFVNRPLRLQNSRTFLKIDRFCKVRTLVDIFVLNTRVSHAHGTCVSLQSHSPFSPSLQTFPLTACARSRAPTCIIYGKKVNSRHRLIWKQNIQAKKVYSRLKLVTSFAGMEERSIFKSCHRPTIRNVRVIVTSRALFDPIPVMRHGILSTHLMLSRFMFVLKMSVLDILK